MVDNGQILRIIIWAVLAAVFLGLASKTRRDRLRREAQERGEQEDEERRDRSDN